jgi:hypothetical protein
MAGSKKRVIKSFENLNEELRELLRRQYPNGYEASITRIKNAKNEPIFVFPLETDDSIFLVKIPVTKNSEGEYDLESTKREEFDNAPDAEDDFASNDDDYDSNEEDYDEDGRDGAKTRREASYDPDFDG